MLRVAAEQQRGVKTAQADGGQRGQDDRAADTLVVEGGGFEFAPQPVAPGVEGKIRAAAFQRLLACFLQLEQHLPGSVGSKWGVHAENINRLVQAFEPARQRSGLVA